MKKIAFVLSLLLLLALAPHPALLSSSQAARQDKNAGYVPQELLVKFTATTDGPMRHAAHNALGATVIAELGDLGWQQVRLPDNLSVTQATSRYLQMSGVEAAQPNYYYHLLPHEEITDETSAPLAPAQPTQTPNDPRFGEMYGMTRISAPTAWDTTTGNSDIVVAVIDTGARYTHQDLAPNIWTNVGETPNNGVDDDGNGFIDDFYGYDFFFNDPDPLDENGHGTHTGGTVGAKGNNALGVTGVNWNVRVMGLKIYNSSGTGSTSAMLVNAYNYVRLMKNRGVNIRATSNSYGGCDEACGYDQATKDALDALGRVNVLNVFAAGNDNSNNDLNPFYPANYDSPHILAVASSTSTDARSGFSNFGATTVDLAAPGSSILSTTNGSNSSYGNNSGTSMACPHVAGAAALLSAAHPNLSQYSLKASLMNNVDVLAQFNGVVLSGGRLNVARAINTPTVCSYALGVTTTALIPASGGTAGVTMTAATNCGWEVLSVPGWITVTTGQVGAGNGSVSLNVAANSGAARMATLVIGGQNFTVTQSGVTPAPTISVNDVSVTEGNSGTVNATFTVSLSAASTQTVTVNYATADGTATAGSDYNQPRGETVTFAPGTTSQTVSVAVNGDTTFEADETFFLNLTGPVNATLNDAQGQATILNDDPAPSIVSFAAATYTVNEGAGSIAVTVNRTGNVALAGSVNYITSSSTLTFTPPLPCSHPDSLRTCDIVPIEGTLNFAANETSKTLVVPIIDDMFTEADETFKVEFRPGGVNTIYGATRETTVTITDNDTLAPTGRTYIAQLSSAQEVPTNNSTATGTGSVTLNDLENQITVSLSFSGLGSTQTAAHIHGAAQMGVNAPILFNLGTGNINGMTFNVTAAQVAQLKKGLFYFNVHTQTFGGGEIRGQILPNPLENVRFFVRQQYLDFLSRTPDQAGSDYWTGQIVTNCGTDLACLHQRRIDVSAAFFVEQEFQETGAFVYRLYKAAYGEQTAYRPTYARFVPDRARVIGGTDLAAGKLNQANAFVAHPDFTTRYPTTLTTAQFVDAILATVQTGAGVTFNSTERTAFIADVNNGGRALMLRNLADNTAFKNAVYNRAFVLMQYFGYLRRDPDQSGYDFWLNVLNQQPNNSRGMVCAFVTADEYQQRFSAVSTRTNQDCGN